MVARAALAQAERQRPAVAEPPDAEQTYLSDWQLKALGWDDARITAARKAAATDGV